MGIESSRGSFGMSLDGDYTGEKLESEFGWGFVIICLVMPAVIGA